MASENPKIVTDAALVPVAYAQLTSLSTAVGVPFQNARVALIQCLSQNVRWRDDGPSPTTTAGMRLHAGESLQYNGDIKILKFIEETAGAEINISFYR